MTPRALPESQGLPGSGQERFPEDAKETARRIALKEEAARILTFESKDDGGGDREETWTQQPGRVRGRIDAVGSRNMEQFRGDQLVESTTHIVTLDPDANVSTRDRIEIEGLVWTITSEQIFSDAASTRIQVKELST